MPFAASSSKNYNRMGSSPSKSNKVFAQANASTGPTLNDIAALLTSSSRPLTRRVIVLAGAGLSVSAGLPDFRSPKTGLYANLERFQLPYPEAVFDVDFFKDTPQPFYTLAKELYPGNYCPTVAHCFVKLLDEKKLLKRCWTQNIDCLEHRTGLDPERIIEAHGSFATATCLRCQHKYQAEDIKETIMDGKVVYCTQKRCQGRKDALVKSDIVFFGESLPDKFFDSLDDFNTCDLLIVTGTSLTVSPFNMLVSKPPTDTPRLLVNLEQVGDDLPGGFDFNGRRRGGKEYARDVAHLTSCDEGFRALAKLCGWEVELDHIVNRVRKEHGLGALPKPKLDNGGADAGAQKAETQAEEVAEQLAKTSLSESSPKENDATVAAAGQTEVSESRNRDNNAANSGL